MSRSLILALLIATASACSSDSDGPTDPPASNPDPPGGGTGNPPPATVDTVFLEASSFNPSNLTIQAGRTVIFFNRGSVLHTVTPQGHSAWQRTETSSRGEVLRVTLDSAGQYDYFCEPHQSMGMTGRITVQ